MQNITFTDLNVCVTNLEKFLYDLPQTAILVQHMKTVIQFNLTEFSFYCASEEKASERPPVAVISVCDTKITPEYHVYYQDEDCVGVIKTLLGTNVDWKRRKIPVHQIPVLTEVAHQEGAILVSDVRLYSFILKSSERLPELQIPEDVCVKRLDGDAAEVINSCWKFKDLDSESVMKKYLDVGISYGVFVNNRLVSWAVVGLMGEISHLFTLPEARGRGFASLVVNKLSRHLLNLGLIPVASIEVANTKSIRLFRDKLGFEYIQDITDLTFQPKSD